jgi:hypothetical protein
MRVRSAASRPPPEADSRLIMHVISAIEPRMPLCWRDLALWPDAIPSLLADGMRGNPKLMMQIEELLRDDVLSTWGAGEGGASGDVLAASPEGRQLRMFLQKGGENAMLRIFYALNPVLPYSAPAAGDAWIIGMADLLRFLEKSIAPGSGPTLIDSPMRAFITARGDRQLEAAVNLMIVTREPRASRMRQIGVLRDLQQRHLPEPLPALTAWAANQLRPELDVWRNRRKRAAVAERLEASVKAGFVGHLLALLEDDTARRQDEEGAERAAMLVAAIDAELAAIDRSDAMRQAATARFGREMAAALGMMALIVMALLAVFG